MITQQEFFRLYNRNSQENKNKVVGDWASKLYRRNISLPIAYFLAGFGVSANAVTVFNLILALTFSTVFIIPSTITLILLIIVYELVYILDNVDGQLARYHGTFSKFGQYFDELSDIFVASYFTIAFGIRLYLDTYNPLFLVLGSFGAISFVFEGLWIKFSDEIVGRYTADSSGSLMHKLRTYLLIFNKISTVALILLILTIFEKFFPSFDLIEWFFIVYICEQFLTKIVFRYYFLLKKAEHVEKAVWKGWPK